VRAVELILKQHKGVVLDVSKRGFDAGAATFATAFYDGERGEICLFYTGASDPDWNEAVIALATSSDGLTFTKRGIVLNSKEFGLREAVTPVVFNANSTFYMVFSGRAPGKGRALYIAYSDDLRGPYTPIKLLIKPQYLWEGRDIDLGPSPVKLSENEVLVYYSNVTNKRPWNIILGPRYLFRTIGILRLKIRSPKEVEAYRFEKNPLKHLNGPKGSWNESLFCPGYFRVGSAHFLLPAASTYSVGYPYKQYIGFVQDSTPFFQKPVRMDVLIEGPKEKREIIPNIKSEIALDTPSPLIKNNELWLYYAVMDRVEKIWRTALSIYEIRYDFQNYSKIYASDLKT